MTEREAIARNYIQAHRLPDNGQLHILRYCVDRIIASNGSCLMEELSRETGYSTRYIRELFARYVGGSPKDTSQIVRMQSALSLIHSHPEVSLGHVAALAGYSDQSHMYRDFMNLTQIPPSAMQSACQIVIEDKNIKTTKFG